MHDRLKTTGSHPTGNLSEPKHRTRSACGRGRGRSVREVPWEEGDRRRLAHSGRPCPQLLQERPLRPGRAQQNSDRRRKRKRHAGGREAGQRQDRVQAGETLAPSHPPSSLGARPQGTGVPTLRGWAVQAVPMEMVPRAPVLKPQQVHVAEPPAPIQGRSRPEWPDGSTAWAPSHARRQGAALGDGLVHTTAETRYRAETNFEKKNKMRKTNK